MEVLGRNFRQRFIFLQRVSQGANVFIERMQQKSCNRKTAESVKEV